MRRLAAIMLLLCISATNDSPQSSMGGLPADEFHNVQGGYATEGGRFGVLVPPDSRVLNANGVAGYCVTNAPGWNGYSGTNCVAAYGWARANQGVNKAALWGANFGVQDTAGTSGQQIQGIEVDVNVNSVHSALVNGIDITGLGKVAHPAATALAINGNAGPRTLWAYGVQISDAATRIAGLWLGAQPGTGSRASQTILLSGYDSRGTGRSAIIQGGSDGDLIFAPSVGRSVIPTVAGGYPLGNPSFPWSGIYIGGTAANNAQITGKFAAQRTFRLPDVDNDTFTMNTARQMLSNKTLSSPTLNTGIANNGSGFQHKRVAGCATSATPGNTCVVTVTWNTAFADKNYTAVCTGDEVASGVPVSGGFKSKTAASVQFQTAALTNAAARWTSIDCLAVHD